VNLLFIHEVNWWTKVIYEIHELPELLSQRGHNVTLIDFPEGVKRTGFRRFLDLKTTTTDGARRAYEQGSVQIRTPGRVFPAPLDRLFASVTFVPLLKQTIRERRPDVIVLYGVPTNGWQTIRVARKFRVPLVFRALDVSHALRKSVFSRLIERAERFIYRNADLVSANNEALAKYCLNQGASPESTVVQYPGMDLDALRPGPKDDDLAQSLGIEPEDRVVMFMGTLYRFAGLDTFLELIAPVLQKTPDLKLLLLGGGEHFEALQKLTRQLKIAEQVIFTGFVDYHSLGKYMLTSSVAINTFPSTLVTNCALPSKVLQYLCCGIPVVATPVDGLAGLVPEGQGVIYRDLDMSFVEAVMDLINNQTLRDDLSSEARAAAEKYLSWARNVTEFETSIRRLVA
jgi:glycosyltransferase involved in cell wall biosynthesis